MSVNVDNLNFQIVRNSEYVDKSVIIALANQVIDTEELFICVTRPRRFGKSVTVKMLNAYYSKGCDSKALFSDLKISSLPDFDKNLNQHDVIYLDMMSFEDKECGWDKYLDILNYKVVSELKDTYRDCFDRDKDYSLPEAIRCIKKRFIFIIDE